MESGHGLEGCAVSAVRFVNLCRVFILKDMTGKPSWDDEMGISGMKKQLDLKQRSYL